MVSVNRVKEVYKFYVYREPSMEEESIKKYEVLRKRLGMILKSEKLRSILLALGSNTHPFQNELFKMSDVDFEEFIDSDTTGKRRKEIFNNYKND